MHMADALLSPAVGGTMFAVSAGLVSYSAREIRRNFQESRIPLMGVTGAFVFAAQMINFTIPGTGSSGHICGGLLLAALLGPAPAFLVMAGVLLVQALFFADGGLLAWGGNLFNMAFFSCFLGYDYLFRPIAGKNPGPGRIMAASCLASVVSLELGAFCVTLETLASGITQLPFTAFLLAMLPIHLAIGLGEGLATGAVLCFVRKNLPSAETLKLTDAKFRPGKLLWMFGLAALVIGGGLSLIASGKPDGLEWSMERTAGTAELENPGAIHTFFQKLAEFFTVLPDYAFPGGETAWGRVVSGVAGVLICGFLLVLLARMLLRKTKVRTVKP